jgi:hypothetical protein
MPFARVNPGDLIQAQNLDQLVDSFNGVAGKGIPIAESSVNDATNYALTVQNLEVTNSRALNVLKSDGSLLIRADVNGVNLGAPLTVANGAIHNAALASDTARANLLTNGGFEIWQRGNGPYTAPGAWTADRWQMNLSGTDTQSISRDSANADTARGSKYCAACTFVLGTGAGSSNIWQLLRLSEYGTANLTVTLSVRVRTSTANAVRLGLNVGGSVVNSGFHTGGGTYETLSVSGTLSGSQDAAVQVQFNASCTAYIDNAMLVVGAQYADYAPLHPADDLARCLRYYEITGQTANSLIFSMNTVNAAVYYWPVFYKAIKPVTPTVTKVGTWTAVGFGQPSMNGIGVDGATLQATASATGAGYVQTASGTYLTVESNP